MSVEPDVNSEPLSYAEMEDMSKPALIRLLQAERHEYGELETPIGELRDYCTMLDIVIDNLTGHNVEKWDNATVKIVLGQEEFQALVFASILAKQASRTLYAQYHKLDGSAEK